MPPARRPRPRLPLSRLLARLIGVAALSAVVAACASAVNVLTPRSGFTKETLAYGAHPRQAFDLYTPKAAPPDAPVVVFIHGGSWRDGSKDIYLFVGEALTALGSPVAIPNYRLYPDVTFPAFVDDGAAAVATVAKRFPDRPLVVMGHSAGAQIAALVALDRSYLDRAGLASCRVAGLIGLSGPYDFLPLTDPILEKTFPEPVREATQPIRYAGVGAPPALLATGTADTTVRPRNTERLAAALAAAGVPVTTRFYEGVSHVGTIAALSRPLRGRAPVLSDIAAFLGAVRDRCR